MTRKIVYLPLDERPCNYLFPSLLADGTEYTIATPPMELMGDKKKPGDTEGISRWLLEQSGDADGVILSLDTLLYGGIVPSRLHNLTVERSMVRLQILDELKKVNPALEVYAFQLLMRCPSYSSSDEEPDYYGQWGREIFQTGYLGHRVEQGIASDDEKRELAHIESQLPPEVLEDYLTRREVNCQASIAALSYVKRGVIDFMIVPQDDSAPFGWTAKDQQLMRERIRDMDLELSVYMYPGADEVGCTLLARIMNRFSGRRPLIYPKLSSVFGAEIIPLYEDRAFYETLKYQTLAAGGLIAASASEADLVLLINSPGETMHESVLQHCVTAAYEVSRNSLELVEYGDYLLSAGKPCAVADIAYANGADLQLIKLLRNKGLLFRLAGYAGWNTSSNTLGTVIAQSMIYLLYGDTTGHRDFLSLRYTEDAGYCSLVRKHITDGPVRERGMTYFQVDGRRGPIAELVREELNRFVEERINDDQHEVVIEDCWQPWGRMFEVGLKTRLIRREREAKDLHGRENMQ